jgi:Raf kinase inhibitor-like YbhB/YbcL family protein
MSQHNLYRRSAMLCFVTALMGIAAPAWAGELSIMSPEFAAGGPIPAAFTCSGVGKSPVLRWNGVPERTRSLALIVRDPDAPMGSFVHWVIYNVPASAAGLPQGVPPAPTLDDGAIQGVNGAGKIGYFGPCPPPGPAHHYHFRLYALDQELKLAAGADAATVERMIEGHVLGAGEVVGTFAR